MGTISTILGGLGTQSRTRRGVVEVLWPEFAREPKVKSVTDQEWAAVSETKTARDVQQDPALLDAIVGNLPRDVSMQILDSLIKQDKPLTAARKREDVGFEVLSSFYTVRDSLRVRHFLSGHTSLKKLLFAAFPKIKETWEGRQIKRQ